RGAAAHRAEPFVAHPRARLPGVAGHLRLPVHAGRGRPPHVGAPDHARDRLLILASRVRSRPRRGIDGAVERQRTIAIPELDVRRVLGTGLGPRDPTTWSEPRALWRATHTSAGPATYRVAWTRGEVEATAWGEGAEAVLDRKIGTASGRE